MPLPRVSSTNPIRMRVTSMPVAWESPPHTPASTRASRAPADRAPQAQVPVAPAPVAGSSTPRAPRRSGARPRALVAGAVRLGWWFWVGRGGHVHPGDRWIRRYPMIARPGGRGHQGCP